MIKFLKIVKENCMDIVNLVISLISGLAGGNLAGAAMQEKNLGPLINSIAGLVGGGLGGYLLKALGLIAAATTTTAATGAAPDLANNAFDLTTLLANIGGSGAGGAVLTAIITALKNASQK